ncbi:MAG: superoxide dismutase [Candidatus Falkowbacteria bacterium]|nr:superoxide dismutase [Candidatus Falkowbacteria bacterium]
MFNLSNLPFEKPALEPFISEKTLEFHYGKHHQTYVDNLNKLIAGTDLENLSVLEIIKKTAGQPEQSSVFNNAAQIYNHDFFWSSLRAVNEKKEISEDFSSLVNASFGGWDNFREEFKNCALTQFGSGWAWLVKDGEKLAFLKTANADSAFLHGVKPLLVIDVWEHAYYLDYQNRRADFALALIDNLLNWDFALNNFRS